MSDKSELVIEQYRLYVESADRMRDRRDRVHRFFVLLNTGVAALVIWMIGDDPGPKNEFIRTGGIFFAVAPGVLALIINLAWFLMLWTHRKIARFKGRIINDLEKELPTAPWTDEYELANKEITLRFTSIEIVFPVIAMSIFGGVSTYLVGLICNP